MIFIGILATITMLFFHGTLKRSLFIGLFCVVFNITMYTAPLTIMVILQIFLLCMHEEYCWDFFFFLHHQDCKYLLLSMYEECCWEFFFFFCSLKTTNIFYCLCMKNIARNFLFSFPMASRLQILFSTIARNFIY